MFMEQETIPFSHGDSKSSLLGYHPNHHTSIENVLAHFENSASVSSTSSCTDSSAYFLSGEHDDDFLELNDLQTLTTSTSTSSPSSFLSSISSNKCISQNDDNNRMYSKSISPELPNTNALLLSGVNRASDDTNNLPNSAEAESESSQNPNTYQDSKPIYKKDGNLTRAIGHRFVSTAGRKNQSSSTQQRKYVPILPRALGYSSTDNPLSTNNCTGKPPYFPDSSFLLPLLLHPPVSLLPEFHDSATLYAQNQLKSPSPPNTTTELNHISSIAHKSNLLPSPTERRNEDSTFRLIFMVFENVEFSINVHIDQDRVQNLLSSAKHYLLSKGIFVPETVNIFTTNASDLPLSQHLLLQLDLVQTNSKETPWVLKDSCLSSFLETNWNDMSVVANDIIMFPETDFPMVDSTEHVTSAVGSANLFNSLLSYTNAESASNAHSTIHNQTVDTCPVSVAVHESLRSHPTYGYCMNQNHSLCTHPHDSVCSNPVNTLSQTSSLGYHDGNSNSSTLCFDTATSYLGGENLKLNRQHVCLYCGACFKRPTHLKRHLLKHTDLFFFECPICFLRFKRKDSFDRHLKKNACKLNNNPGASSSNDHNNQPKCSSFGIHSNQNVENRDLASMNIRKHVNISAPKYTCFICSRTFSKKEKFQNHLESHNKPGSFKCQYCDKYFTLLHKLKRHEQSHSENKPYRCEVCLNDWTRQESLNKHYKTTECGLKRQLRSSHSPIDDMTAFAL